MHIRNIKKFLLRNYTSSKAHSVSTKCYQKAWINLNSSLRHRNQIYAIFFSLEYFKELKNYSVVIYSNQYCHKTKKNFLCVADCPSNFHKNSKGGTADKPHIHGQISRDNMWKLKVVGKNINRRNSLWWGLLVSYQYTRIDTYCVL